MSKFYVQDPLLKRVVYHNTVSDVVRHLSEMVKPLTGHSKAEFIQHLIDLGHGYDDPQGVMFTRAMAEKVNIGVLNKDKTHVRCDVHEVTNFQKEEYGD